MASLSPIPVCNGRFLDVWRNILLRSSSPSIAIPAAVISIPSILSDIWGGILKAVPKKKTSHMKRRHRFMANNTLKDIQSVVKCPGCGKPKRAHLLCPYCVAEIKAAWQTPFRTLKKMKVKKAAEQQIAMAKLSDRPAWQKITQKIAQAVTPWKSGKPKS